MRGFTRLSPALLLVAGACSPASGPAATQSLSLGDCEVEGHAGAMRCGTLSVPEDPARPDGRRIDLNIVVIPAVAPDPAQAPLYEFAGGPGLAVTESAIFYLTDGAAHRQHRDIVLVDQRGTGGSAPLACPDLADERDRPMFRVDEVAACRERLAREADLSQYTTANTVADLQAVRAALGHGPVDLFGISYGTRVALAWIAAEPAAIRTAVLVGTVPDDAHVPLWHARHAQDTLDAVFADCRADAACARAFPTLDADWATLLARDDFDGPAREAFRGFLQTTPGQRQLPATIAAMAVAGPPAPPEGADGPRYFDGLFLSATCAEDVPWIDDAAVAGAVRGTFLGDYRVVRQRAACAVWDVPPRELRYARADADVPVLFIAGERDYVTPVAWAERVAGRFARGRLVTVPALGHFPAGLANMGCLDALLLGVAADADLSRLDTACVATMSPPPFASR